VEDRIEADRRRLREISMMPEPQRTSEDMAWFEARKQSERLKERQQRRTIFERTFRGTRRVSKGTVEVFTKSIKIRSDKVGDAEVQGTEMSVLAPVVPDGLGADQEVPTFPTPGIGQGPQLGYGVTAGAGGGAPEGMPQGRRGTWRERATGFFRRTTGRLGGGGRLSVQEVQWRNEPAGAQTQPAVAPNVAATAAATEVGNVAAAVVSGAAAVGATAAACNAAGTGADNPQQPRNGAPIAPLTAALPPQA
jgi:hypothetical protein